MLPLRQEAPAIEGVSAIVPVHDEEAAITDVVQALLDELPRVASRFEVIVVDDGSTDRTGTVLDGLAQSISSLRVVRHAQNRGYGAALRSGFAAARHAWVLVIDGDGQIDPRQLGAVVAALDDHDGVVGYRAQRAEAWPRRLNTAAWNGVVRWLFGLEARDLNCAFKLLPTALVQDEPLRADGAVISAEILLRAAQAGYHLAEVPVEHHPRRAGRASGARMHVVARAGVELLRLYLRPASGGRA